MSIFTDQAEFMALGGQTTTENNTKQALLYQQLINEEYWEFRDALEKEPLQNQIKECMDVLVVLSGWLLSKGIDAQHAWNLVHANNLAKVQDKTTKDENGKIQKSPESIARKSQLLLDLFKLTE